MQIARAEQLHRGKWRTRSRRLIGQKSRRCSGASVAMRRRWEKGPLRGQGPVNIGVGVWCRRGQFLTAVPRTYEQEGEAVSAGIRRSSVPGRHLCHCQCHPGSRPRISCRGARARWHGCKQKREQGCTDSASLLSEPRGDAYLPGRGSRSGGQASHLVPWRAPIGSVALSRPPGGERPSAEAHGARGTGHGAWSRAATSGSASSVSMRHWATLQIPATHSVAIPLVASDVGRFRGATFSCLLQTSYMLLCGLTRHCWPSLASPASSHLTCCRSCAGTRRRGNGSLRRLLSPSSSPSCSHRVSAYSHPCPRPARRRAPCTSLTNRTTSQLDIPLPARRPVASSSLGDPGRSRLDLPSSRLPIPTRASERAKTRA